MMLMMIQVENDPTADTIAANLGALVDVRFGATDTTANVSFGHAVLLVVWSAAAERFGAARLQQLCRDASPVIVIEHGATAPRDAFQGATRLSWTCETRGAIAAIVSQAKGAEISAGSRPRTPMMRTLARLAAGALAALGFLAPQMAAASDAKPAATERSLFTATPTSAPALAETFAAEPIAFQEASVTADSVVHLSSTPAPSTEAAAQALTEALLQPQPMRVALARAEQRPQPFGLFY